MSSTATTTSTTSTTSTTARKASDCATLLHVRNELRTMVDSDAYGTLSESITAAGKAATANVKFATAQTLAMVTILDATVTPEDSEDFDGLTASLSIAQDVWKLTTRGYKLSGLLSDGSPYFTHVSKLVMLGMTSADILDYLTTDAGKIRGLSSLGALANDLTKVAPKLTTGDDSTDDDSTDDSTGGERDIHADAEKMIERMGTIASDLIELFSEGAVVNGDSWSSFVNQIRACNATRTAAMDSEDGTSPALPAPKTTTRKGSKVTA